MGKLETNHCYKVVVWIFGGIYFISYPKDEQPLLRYLTSGGWVHSASSMSPNLSHQTNAVVSGVSQIFKYKSCNKIEATNNFYGQCRSCGMLQNLDGVKETLGVLMVKKWKWKRIMNRVVSRKKIFWKANHFHLKSIKETLSGIDLALWTMLWIRQQLNVWIVPISRRTLNSCNISFK